VPQGEKSGDRGGPVLAILGPTASGKTDIALSLAKKIPIQIISMDSVMVYKGMDIGSAKPNKATLRAFPHALVDIREPHDTYSAADFVSDADLQVKRAWSLGKLPVLVGGTMLYMKAYREGLAPLPPADEDVRLEIEIETEVSGFAGLYDQLREIDPEAARKIHPNNTQRLKRAIEVYRLSGTPISAYWKAQTASDAISRLQAKILSVALIPEDRAVWHDKIEARFVQMLSDGFIGEVEELKSRGGLNKGLPSMRSVGYRQAWEYLDGNSSLEEFEERSIAATRQLAKRQLTWLKSWDWITVITDGSQKKFDKVIDELIEDLVIF
tara:strand:+ start:32 stop:1006 length:975 start_codon:yes stop_codon:yes gene_type:complete